MADELDPEVIAELATAPKKSETDEGKVEERSMTDIIAADRYLKSKKADTPPYGMRIAKVKPPGSI